MVKTVWLMNVSKYGLHQICSRFAIIFTTSLPICKFEQIHFFVHCVVALLVFLQRNSNYTSVFPLPSLRELLRMLYFWLFYGLVTPCFRWESKCRELCWVRYRVAVRFCMETTKLYITPVRGLGGVSLALIIKMFSLFVIYYKSVLRRSPPASHENVANILSWYVLDWALLCRVAHQYDRSKSKTE